MTRLAAPMPWYGGKARWADEIWSRLGDVGVYVEPFAGSLGVLLAGPAHSREIVCDLDGMICNFWRAMRDAPEETARWADYPTIHQDLTARRYWLRSWREAHAERLSLDAEFYCPKAAGWWAWCVSCWIGAMNDLLDTTWDKRPHVANTDGGRGVSVQRLNVRLKDKRPQVSNNAGGKGIQVQRIQLIDKRPLVYDHSGGPGVSAQRLELPDKMPALGPKTGGRGVQAQRLHPGRPRVSPTGGGMGVQAQRKDMGGPIGEGARLLPWFEELSQRLARVVVLNRDWSSALSDTLLQQTPKSPKPLVGVFLDPPYRLQGRRRLYVSDLDENEGDAAELSYEWAVSHGDVYRIAYACRESDFPCPEGWTSSTPRTFGGHRVEKERRSKDVVYYSPACVPATQAKLL